MSRQLARAFPRRPRLGAYIPAPMRNTFNLSALALLLLTAGCPTDPAVDTTWREAFDASDTGWRMNIWGTSPTELYSAGGSLAEGVLVRFDGTEGTEVELPAAFPLLNWTIGFGSDDIHVVGNDGTTLHFDGTTWTVLDSSTDQDLWGVWGAASNDVWAVGGTARAAGGVPTLIHFDGSAWSSVTVPALTPTSVHALFKVWGSSATDVYVVGDSGAVVHYDGSTWEEVLVGAEDDLVAVWGTGPDDVTMVGGRSNGIAAHWNGTEWRTESLSPLPGLNGVWMREPGVAHIVGLRGTIAVFDTASFTYEEALPDEVLDYHAVFGVDGELFAVGGNLAVPSGARGMAWRRQLAPGE